MGGARCAAALVLLYLSISFLLGVVAGARNVSVDDTAPQWTFTPAVCPHACDGSQPGIPRGWYVLPARIQLEAGPLNLDPRIRRWQLANLRDPAGLDGFFQSTETATNLVGASASLRFFGKRSIVLPARIWVS